MLLPRLIVCFIVGIAFADGFIEVLSGGAHYLLMSAACAFLLSILWYKGRRMFCLPLAASFFLLGASLLVNERDAIGVEWGDEERAYCVKHLAHIKETPKTYQMDGEVQGKRVRLTLLRDSLSVKPSPSQSLWIYAQIKAPKNAGNPGEFDYANYLLRQNISGTAFCSEVAWKVLNAEEDDNLWAQLSNLRRHLLERLRADVKGQSLEVVSAMTLGDKRLISKETRQLYAETGASHVLALSGLHLSILFALFNLLLFRPLRSVRFLGVAVQCGFLLAVWGFVMMVDMPLSLLRAAIMLTLVQLGLLLRRDRISLHNLSIAALILLMWSPQSLFDVGFQLSFMAVVSILLVMPHLPRWTSFTEQYTLGGRFKQWSINAVQDLLRVSLAAQIGTLPLVLFYFHQFPTYALLVSFWVIPLAGVVLTLSLLYFLLPGLSFMLGDVLNAVLQLLNAGLECFSALPFASFECAITLPSTMLLYFLPGLIIWGLRHYRRRRLMMIGVGSVILGIGFSEIYAQRAKVIECATPELIIYNTRHAMAVHTILSPQCSYLWTTDSVRTSEALHYIASSYWQKRSLPQPHNIVGDTLLPSLMTRDNLLQVGEFRLSRVGYYKDAPLPATPPSTPLSVNALLLYRGCTEDLTRILQFYNPSLIILDASMSGSRRQNYSSAAKDKGIPIYDVSENGAYKYPLTSTPY